MLWIDAVRNAMKRACSAKGSDTFYRQELISREMDRIVSDTSSRGRTPEQTLSRVLQELRDLGEVQFLDAGRYRVLVDYP